MTRWWRQAEELAGLDHQEWLGWHSLRRRFAIDLMKEVPLKVICDLGGWSGPETVVRCYQSTTQEDLREALSRRKTG
jgi:hypothetical protein